MPHNNNLAVLKFAQTLRISITISKKKKKKNGLIIKTVKETQEKGRIEYGIEQTYNSCRSDLTRFSIGFTSITDFLMSLFSGVTSECSFLCSGTI